jgi:hypothetical protein
MTHTFVALALSTADLGALPAVRVKRAQPTTKKSCHADIGADLVVEGA